MQRDKQGVISTVANELAPRNNQDIAMESQPQRFENEPQQLKESLAQRTVQQSKLEMNAVEKSASSLPEAGQDVMHENSLFSLMQDDFTSILTQYKATLNAHLEQQRGQLISYLSLKQIELIQNFSVESENGAIEPSILASYLSDLNDTVCTSLSNVETFCKTQMTNQQAKLHEEFAKRFFSTYDHLKEQISYQKTKDRQTLAHQRRAAQTQLIQQSLHDHVAADERMQVLLASHAKNLQDLTDQYNKEITALKCQIKELEDDNTAIHFQKEKIKLQLDDIKAKYAEAQNAPTVLVSSAFSKKHADIIKSLRQSIETTTNDLKMYKRKYDHTSMQLGIQSALSNELQSSNEKSKDELRACQILLSEAHGELLKMKEWNGTLNQEKMSSNEEKRTLVGQLGHCQELIEAQEKRILDNKRIIEALENSVFSMQKETITLRSQVSNLREQLMEKSKVMLISELRESTDDIERYQAKLRDQLYHDFESQFKQQSLEKLEQEFRDVQIAICEAKVTNKIHADFEKILQRRVGYERDRLLKSIQESFQIKTPVKHQMTSFIQQGYKTFPTATLDAENIDALNIRIVQLEKALEKAENQTKTATDENKLEVETMKLVLQEKDMLLRELNGKCKDLRERNHALIADMKIIMKQHEMVMENSRHQQVMSIKGMIGPSPLARDDGRELKSPTTLLASTSKPGLRQNDQVPLRPHTASQLNFSSRYSCTSDGAEEKKRAILLDSSQVSIGQSLSPSSQHIRSQLKQEYFDIKKDLGSQNKKSNGTRPSSARASFGRRGVGKILERRGML